MSLATEIFGDVILNFRKEIVISLIKGSPFIEVDQRDKVLRDWGAATATDLQASDFAALEVVNK